MSSPAERETELRWTPSRQPRRGTQLELQDVAAASTLVRAFEHPASEEAKAILAEFLDVAQRGDLRGEQLVCGWALARRLDQLTKPLQKR